MSPAVRRRRARWVLAVLSQHAATRIWLRWFGPRGGALRPLGAAFAQVPQPLLQLVLALALALVQGLRGVARMALRPPTAWAGTRIIVRGCATHAAPIAPDR